MLKGGQVVFDKGRCVAACIVRDISERGARIEVSSVIGIPSEFTLLLDDRSAAPVCFVKWRNQTTLGVEFLPKTAVSFS